MCRLSQTSVRSLPTWARRARLDAVIHNAGVMAAQRTETADGHELCLATHVLGPLLLTELLLPLLAAAPDPRVVLMSSGGSTPSRWLPTTSNTEPAATAVPPPTPAANVSRSPDAAAGAPLGGAVGDGRRDAPGLGRHPRNRAGTARVSPPDPPHPAPPSRPPTPQYGLRLRHRRHRRGISGMTAAPDPPITCPRPATPKPNSGRYGGTAQVRSACPDHPTRCRRQPRKANLTR